LIETESQDSQAAEQDALVFELSNGEASGAGASDSESNSNSDAEYSSFGSFDFDAIAGFDII
jgi:hypothetical protein